MRIAEILEKSFFEAGLTTELQHATPTQTRNAMDTISDVIAFAYGTTVGEKLNPWPLGNFGRSTQSRTLPTLQVLQRPWINSELVAVNEEAMTVYLPVDPSDGARVGLIDPFSRLASVPITLDGNGRTIEAAATKLLNTNGTNTTWLYRADLGNWAKLSPLLITDDLPFPADYNRMFIILMAMHLNPAYGRNISSTQAQFLKGYQQQFQARYVQSQPLEINTDISFGTRQSYNNWADAWFGGGSQEAWDRGGWWW